MNKKNKGPGRPKITEKERRKDVICIRLKPDERKALESAATAEGKSLSVWVREKLLDL